MPNLIWFQWARCSDGYGAETISPGEVELLPRDAPIWVVDEASDAEWQELRTLSPRKDASESTRRVIETCEDQFLEYSDLGYARWRLPDESTTFVCPESHNIQTFSPFETGRLIFREFANLGSSRSDVLAFANRYGTLLASDGLRAERLGTWFREIEEMRSTVALWEKQQDSGSDMTSFVRSSERRFGEIKLHVRLAVGADRSEPNFYLEPDNLLDAMWLQFGQTISANHQLQRCAVCTTWFAFGSGTGRRKSAQYCSDKCRKAASRQRLRSK